MPVPSIPWPDEDRLLIEMLAAQVRQRGLYSLLDIPGVREPLGRWFRDEIRQRSQAAQAPPPWPV